MELKEYYKIWREHISVVIYTVVIAAVAAYAWSMRISQNYKASLLLNVSRTETQNTSDYRYDQFYRLQADEKFAETIVEWLESAGASRDIFEKSGLTWNQKTIRQLAKSFHAEKISSGLVSVQFSAESEDEARKISKAIAEVISVKTSAINSAEDPYWFKVEMSDFIALKNTQDLRINLGIATLAGLFIGTLLAFGKHYIAE